MLEKSIKTSYLLILSLFFIIMGILLIVLKVTFANLVIKIIGYGFIFKGLIKLLMLIYNKENRKKEFVTKEVLDIIFGVIIIGIKGTIIYLLPIVFSIYYLCIVIIRVVDYYIYQKNKFKGRLGILVSIVLNLIFSIIFAINPHIKTKYVMIIIGIYLIIIGVKTFSDFLFEVLPIKFVNKIKLNIQIPIPEIFTAFIPQKLINLFNEVLEPNQVVTQYNHIKNTDKPDLEIILHLAKNGTAAMGHLEIAFDDIVYSYGNYDMHSRSLFQALGDGIILIVDKKKYIKYCVEKRNRYIIEFGLKLTDKEKQIIKKNIYDLVNNNTIDYFSDAQLMEQGKIPKSKTTDMSSEIYLYAGGRYKKIIKGKYKKFFVLNNNCAMMVRSVLKTIGKDIIAINGILTPGAYYNYLNNQFILKNTNVITRKIYTKNEIKNS